MNGEYSFEYIPEGGTEYRRFFMSYPTLEKAKEQAADYFKYSKQNRNVKRIVQ